ncbi:hypothetical protein BCF53_105114 [Reinekea marinisedimentorum]|uniref:Uncharacterized protein n=1 Tax=Reinekea marinisedimentorum TaxID=230495 RepID=A0A4R3IB64_9GAMM|nr:hypothetical protein BCF53_105114 [Reinekea marinisedimentorum]
MPAIRSRLKQMSATNIQNIDIGTCSVISLFSAGKPMQITKTAENDH